MFHDYVKCSKCGKTFNCVAGVYMIASTPFFSGKITEEYDLCMDCWKQIKSMICFKDEAAVTDSYKIAQRNETL